MESNRFMSAAAERRKEDRVLFNSSAYVEKEYFGGADDALITNISTNGISIQTTLPLDHGEYVSIQIENPVTFEKIRVMGEVSWIDQTDENTSQVGVEFHPMDKTLKDKFAKLLASVDTNYEPTNPRKNFDANNNIQAEIEKILQIPSQQIHEEPPSPPKTENPEPLRPSPSIEFKTAPVIPNKAKKTTSLFTIVLLLLLIIAGVVSYYLYEQVARQEQAIQKELGQAMTVESNPDIIEQDLNEEGAVEKTQTIQTAPPEVVKEFFPYHGAMQFNAQKWLKEVSWKGNDTSIQTQWSFTQTVDVQSIKIQKLDFDPKKIRYLIRIPSPNEVLQVKEVTIDHPLVTKARMGLHGTTNKEIHIVFDVASPTIELSTQSASSKVLQISFQ